MVVIDLYTRHIVHELQREVSDATQKIKILESEKHLLISEADQLRQVGKFILPSSLFPTFYFKEIHILEDNLDHSLSEENTGVAELLISTDNNMGSLEHKLQDQKVRFEVNQHFHIFTH